MQLSDKCLKHHWILTVINVALVAVNFMLLVLFAATWNVIKRTKARWEDDG